MKRQKTKMFLSFQILLFLKILLSFFWFLRGIWFFKIEASSWQKKISFYIFVSTFLFCSVVFVFDMLLVLELLPATLHLKTAQAIIDLAPKAMFIGASFVTIFYDFTERMIPDFCTKDLWWFFSFLTLLELQAFQIFGALQSAILIEWARVIGLSLSYFLAFYLTNKIFFYFKQKIAIGNADMWIIAAYAVFFGQFLTNIILLSASGLGIVYAVATKEKDIPFGALLSGSATACLLLKNL